jgi:hypothetical protein
MMSTKNSQNSALIQEIADLQARGGSDWQSLARQSESNFVPLTYNAAQFANSVAIQRYKVVSNVWGRGTGKTTSLGDTIRQMMRSMPRAVGAFVSPSYQFFLTRIIPSLVQGLEMQGLYQNLHYFVGRRPPKSWNWPECYQPPSDYSKFVCFYNGFGFHLVSQDLAGDGRGLNLDFILTDESALIDKVKLGETVEPALRGTNREALEKSPFFGIQVHHTSMPLTQRGQWIFDLESAQLESPGTIKIIKANALINKDNLMEGYLQERKKTTIPWIFKSEYLNIKPNQIENGFYALLDENKHGYNGNYNYNHLSRIGQRHDSLADADCDGTLPLIIGVDWGSVINSLVIAQSHPGELRIIKSMYVLGENKETQDDLADRFCEYYAGQINRTIFMHYDRTGNVGTGNTRNTRAQQFIKRLTDRGFRVQPLTQGGRNPEHEKKRLVWETLLKGTHTHLPTIRVNMSNARDLYISMQNAKVKRSSTGIIQKDKSSERSTAKKRQHATDLSDAGDTIIFGMFSQKIKSGGALLHG